ncbi:MarR family winged helix-turn-helix transcriptional regulator [Fodinibius salsisoli]|uniref:MarR family transcriptional regulator n=1 Tax=Fodinibius salsisoli TaxID=2820877 RepID=A0ABT3PH16_9BACT|nr:MarR family transcriptional regulator [Fodinibius salsisoli]MCW9705212.1 MarR family transcriptional regulator [Fodinibius salsisoli]
MEFKQAIKQKRFPSPQMEAILNMVYSANHFENIMRKLLHEFDLSHEQFNVLRILRGNHPGAYELNQIRDRMLNSWSNVSRLVEKLRKKGFVTRQPKPENRRKVEIKITQDGLDFLEQVDANLTTAELMKQTLDDEKAAQLTALLDELRTNLDNVFNGPDNLE